MEVSKTDRLAWYSSPYNTTISFQLISCIIAIIISQSHTVQYLHLDSGFERGLIAGFAVVLVSNPAEIGDDSQGSELPLRSKKTDTIKDIDWIDLWTQA